GDNRVLNFIDRGSTIVAMLSLAVALGTLVWNWFVLYKERRPHPWVRMIAAAIALPVAAWISTDWMTDYHPNDHYDANFSAGSRVIFSGIVLVCWVLFCVVWRFLDRYRTRPNWIFFGFGSTIFMSAVFLAAGSTLAIALGILIRRPDFMWPGL